MRTLASLAIPALLVLAPSAPAAAPTTLEGNGVAVTLDLDGFKKDLDAGPLRGTYWRLGQFSLEPDGRARSGGLPLVVSVLVDEVPAGVDLAALRDHVLGSVRERAGGTPPEVTATPGGFSFSFREEFAQGLKQWHLYYHTLHGRKWIELHFSSMPGAQRDLTSPQALASKIIGSVRVASAPPPKG